MPSFANVGEAFGSRDCCERRESQTWCSGTVWKEVVLFALYILVSLSEEVCASIPPVHGVLPLSAHPATRENARMTA